MDFQAYNYGVLVIEPSSDPPDVCSSEKKITLPLGTDQSTPTLERISKIGSSYFTTNTSKSNNTNNKPKSNNTALDMISQLNNQVELILESISSQQDTAQSDINSNGTENGRNTSPAIKISIPILTNEYHENKVDLNPSNHFDNEDVVMVKSPEEANPVTIACTTQNKEKMEVTLSDHNTIDEKNNPNNQDVAMLTFITLNGPSDESCMDESTIEQDNGKNHVDMDVTTLDMILQPRNKEDVDMLESNSNSMSITEKMDLADTSPVNKQDVIMQELSFSEKMDITSNYNIELYNQDMPMLEVPISGKIPGSLLCKIALPNTTLAKICKDTIKKEPPKCERVAQKRNSNHEIETEPPFSKKEKLDERPEKPVPMQVCNNPNSFFLATFSMLNSMEEICGNEEIVSLCNESNDNKTKASKEVLLESVLAENSAQEYLWQCLECPKEPHCNKVVRGEEPNEVLVKTGPNNATVTKQNCTDKLKSTEFMSKPFGIKSNKQNFKQANGVVVAEENNNIETIQSKTGQENLVKSSTQNYNETAKNIKSNTNTVKVKTNNTPPASKQKHYTNSATVAEKNGVPKGSPNKSERLPLKQNQNCKVGEERTRTKSTKNNIAIVEDNSKTLSLKTGTCIKENNNLKTRVFSAGNEVKKKLPSKPYRELDKSNEPILITQPCNTRDKINRVNKKNPVLENLKHPKTSQESEKCCNSAESPFKVPCRYTKCQDVCSQDRPEDCHFDKMFSGVDLFEDEDFLDDCSLLESGWHIPIHAKKEQFGRPWHVPIQIKEEPVISLLTSSESEESDCSQSALGTDTRTKKRKKKSHDSFPRKFVQKSVIAQRDKPENHQTTGLSKPNLVRPDEGAKKDEAKRDDKKVQKGQTEAEQKTLNNEVALLKRQKQEEAAGEKENMTFLELNGSDVVVHKSETESLSNKKRKGQQVSSEHAKKLKVGTSEEVTRKSDHSTSGNKNTCSCENCRKQESSNKPKGNAELKHRGTNRFASSNFENGNVATSEEPKVINDQKETKTSEKKRDRNMKQKDCNKEKVGREIINKQSKVGLEEHKKNHNNKQNIDKSSKKREQITRSKTEITNDQTKIGKSEDRNNQKIKQNSEPVKPNSIEEYRHVTLEKMDRVVRENKKKELERLLRKGSEEEILKMKIAEEENRQKDLQRKMELGRIQVEQIIEQVKKKEIERQRSLEENGFPPQILRSFKTSGEENNIPSTILERREKTVLKMDFEAQPNSVAEPPKVNQVQQFEVTDKNKSLLVYHCNECNKLHFSPRNDYRLVCQELGDEHANNEPRILGPVNVSQVQPRRRPVLRQRVRNIIEIESCFSPTRAIPEVVALTVQVRNNSGQVETVIYNLPTNRRLVPISPEDFEAARQFFLNRRRERIQGDNIDNDSPEGREYISRQHYRSGPYYFRPDDRVDRVSAPNRQLVDIRFPNNMYSGSKTSIATQTDERENSEAESVDSCYYETENSQFVQSGHTKSRGDKSDSSGGEESDSDYDELTELRQQVERSMIRMKEMETQIAKYDLERRIAEYKMKQAQSCCGMSMADKELWERCKLYTNTIFCEKCQELRLKMLYKSRSKEAMKSEGASINDDAPQATQEEDVFSTPTDDNDEAETDSDSIQKQEQPAEKQKESTKKKDDTSSEDSKRMPPPKILAATSSLLNNYQRQNLLQSIASLPMNAPAQVQSFEFQGTYLAPKKPSIPKQDFMATYEKLMVPTIIAGVNNILHQQNVANNMNVTEMPQPSGNTNNNTPYPINYSRSDSDSEDEKYSRFYKLLKHYNKPRIGAWQDDSSDEASNTTIVSKQLLRQLIDKTGTLTKTLSAIDFRKTIQKKNLNSIATQDTCNKLSNFQFSSVIIAPGDSIGGNQSNMGILCQTGKKFNCSCLQTYSRCISPGKCYLNWSFSHNKITKHYEQSRSHTTLQHVQMASNPVGMTFYEVYLLNVIRSIRNNSSHLSISIPVINPSFCLNLSEVNIKDMTIQLNQENGSSKNRQYKRSFDDIVEYIRTYLNMSERMAGLEVGVLKKLRQICSPNILPQEITTLLQKLEFTYRSYQMAKENFLAGDNRALLPIFECMQFLLMGSSAGSR